MANSDGSPAPPRRRHIVRLALFAAFLLALFYLVAVMRIVDVEAVRRTVAATGAAAPLAYVVVSAVLGAVFVPGPILAAGSGVLFGPLLGTLMTLGATVGTATITSLIGRRAGRDGARALLGAERADRLDARIGRGGLWAVVGQRFVPGISDALASYAFGAFAVPLWQMAVGAFVGSAPRAFVYTALGASISDLSSPLAYVAIGVWCVTAIIGAFAARSGYRRWRGRPGIAPMRGFAKRKQTVEAQPAAVVTASEGFTQARASPCCAPSPSSANTTAATPNQNTVGAIPNGPAAWPASTTGTPKAA